MTGDPIASSAAELVALLQSGAVTSVELTQAYLARIDQYDPAIKAFLRVDHEQALARAAQIDERRRRVCHIVRGDRATLCANSLDSSKTPIT